MSLSFMTGEAARTQISLASLGPCVSIIMRKRHWWRFCAHSMIQHTLTSEPYVIGRFAPLANHLTPTLGALETCKLRFRTLSELISHRTRALGLHLGDR